MYFLVTLENIACINLILHIIQTLVIAVCNDSLTHFLELIQVINNHGYQRMYPRLSGSAHK